MVPDGLVQVRINNLLHTFSNFGVGPLTKEAVQTRTPGVVRTGNKKRQIDGQLQGSFI